MVIPGEKIPKVSNQVRVREEEFGLLLVSKKTPILALNKDSQIIWEYINGKYTVNQIIELLNSAINGDEAETEKIVKCFIESCYELRLIDLL